MHHEAAPLHSSGLHLRFWNGPACTALDLRPAHVVTLPPVWNKRLTYPRCCGFYLLFAVLFAVNILSSTCDDDDSEIKMWNTLAIAFRFVAAIFYGLDGVLLVKTVGCDDSQR